MADVSARVGRVARSALACFVVSLGLMVLLGLLGPSAGQPDLPGRRSALPPWSLAVAPPTWLVCLLMYALVIVGAVGTHLALRAVALGWAPPTRRLLTASLAGCVALLLVPPMGSSDVLQYAAYGRIAARYGGDVYGTTPRQVTSAVADPVTAAVGPAWPDTPSVYGPVATWVQQAASWIGGESVHTTVWVLQLVHGTAFIGVCLLALRLAGREPSARARAIVLTAVNPVLVWVVLVGAHVDALAVLAGVAALVAVRRSPLAAGLLLGLAGAVKVSLVLYGLALLWAVRRSSRGVVHLCAGAAVVLAGTYLTTSHHAFRQVLSAASFVASSSPLAPLSAGMHAILPARAASLLVEAVALAAMVALVIAVGRALRPAVPERAFSAQAVPAARTEPAPGTEVTSEAVRAAAVLSVAWLLSAPYTAAWYDLLAWLPLAVAAASRLDRVMLVRTTVLAVAAVPGLVLELTPPWLEFVTQRLRDTLAPAVGIALIIVTLLWARRSAKGEVTAEDVLPVARHR